MLVLTRERKARGWSKSRLGRRADMAGGTVGQIEAKRFRPYDSQLKKLAKALGWPTGEAQRLLDDVGEPEATTEVRE